MLAKLAARTIQMVALVAVIAAAPAVLPAVSQWSNNQRIAATEPSATPQAVAAATPQPSSGGCPTSGYRSPLQPHPGIVNIDAGNFFGTGIVLDPHTILTNDHVLADAITGVCVSGSHARQLATIVGEDPTHDIALLRVQTTITAARLGNSANVIVGAHVTAIGNNINALIGEASVVALGVPATLNGPEGNQRRLTGLIETTGGVLPGDSGGPLLTTGGEVIGVNTGKASTGQGLAIPINSALAYAHALDRSL